jgi:hypothetical protein
MATTKAKTHVSELERLITVVQDLFILEALKEDATNEAIREFLHVGQWRVVNVSKVLKSAKRRKE